MQRHHLLPRQLLTYPALHCLFDAIGCETIAYHDFRANGLLLPCDDGAAARFGLPLHRGPHRCYNAMVLDRVGRIEADWSRRCGGEPIAAREEAVMRLQLPQRALRRRLLDPRRRPITLNRRQLTSPALDFTELDAMADALWGAADAVQADLCRRLRGAGDAARGRVDATGLYRTTSAGDTTPLAALNTARTLAVAMSSSMPTPQIVRPSRVVHST